MQSMQRRIQGRFHAKTADESQVSVLLKDFEEADKMLTKVRGDIPISLQSLSN